MMLEICARHPPLNKANGTYVYCPFCDKAWPGWDANDYKVHPNHNGIALEYPGIYIDLSFLSEADEKDLIHNLDYMPWDLSQSGRRKQNFGPKSCSKFVQDKFNFISILKEFQTIEQCSLEYNPERGASIDPHIDDCWIWGERIVTVNLLSDSVLTMSYNSKPERYNLDCVNTYPCILDENGKINVTNKNFSITSSISENKYPIVRIPMPRRSLLVMYGSARYNWEHQVLREDILSRRVCLAYREFTPPYLEYGEKYEEGEEYTFTSQRILGF
ncbi:hypothetical protein NQ314_003691 [Rhamnusium bicolor]|uniref:Isopenicillin N synthase-like Fe(2+) 2OG dioxygenase domain-containing protein n=1 Tax=Rhamnusium bicolor TaxID=1586634 RepID=A0AAV8ZN19_9CUCU|nr:hypothetical protein NQ314_003691 [Rhamnusium bicolor]